MVYLLLDEGVDDVILESIHDEGEDHHDECDLELLVALCPSERPVADLRDPGHHDEDDEDTDLHAKQPGEVYKGLLEPPPGVGRVAVVARLDRLDGLAERCEARQGAEDAQEHNEDGDADSSLFGQVSARIQTTSRL